MALLGDFCRIDSVCPNGGGHDYTVCFNGEHLVYKAHFPGEAVTPGACILQIALELLRLETGRRLELVKAKNIKFLKIIAPSVTPAVCFSVQAVSLSDEMISAAIKVVNGDDVYAKLSVVCRITD